MFSGNTHELPYVRDYAEAHAHWEKTPFPSRSKKWSPHQRPLKNTQSPHYRLEKGDGYYDVCLYTTVMARFFEPTSIGERRCYLGHHSQTSQKFMADVLSVWPFKRHYTTDGREVIAPITGKKMPHSEFSADLLFVHGKLDVAASQHAPIFKQVSSDQDKADRKHVKQALDPLLTLCVMRMPELELSTTADFNVAGHFYSARTHYAQERDIALLVKDIMIGDQPQTNHVNAFMGMADSIYQKIVSDRAMALGMIGWNTQGCAATDLPSDQRVTEKEFIASIWRMVQKHGRLGNRSATAPYPMFPTPDQITLTNVVTWQK
jgi:hypothetical protein